MEFTVWSLMLQSWVYSQSNPYANKQVHEYDA